MTTKYIWDLYATDVKQFILSKVNNASIADDILQDTFIKIHTKLHTLKNNSKLKPWIFSVARYTVLDYFKTTKRTIGFDLKEPVVEIEHEMHSEKDCLRGILINLPKKYRVPLFFSDIMGEKQHKIAKLLNLPLPTIKSQIQRGRKLIAKGFMDCCGYEMNAKGYLVGEIKAKADCKVCN